MAGPLRRASAEKWLKAGLLEDGDVTVDDRGTGQGSVDFTASCECLSALRPGPMGQTLETREATGDMIIVRYRR